MAIMLKPQRGNIYFWLIFIDQFLSLVKLLVTLHVMYLHYKKCNIKRNLTSDENWLIKVEIRFSLLELLLNP